MQSNGQKTVFKSAQVWCEAPHEKFCHSSTIGPALWFQRCQRSRFRHDPDAPPSPPLPWPESNELFSLSTVPSTTFLPKPLDSGKSTPDAALDYAGLNDKFCFKPRHIDAQKILFRRRMLHFDHHRHQYRLSHPRAAKYFVPDAKAKPINTGRRWYPLISDPPDN